MTRLRQALALAFVLAGLLAGAAAWKSQTCSCAGTLPYDVIALYAGLCAAASLGAYLTISFALRRG